MDRISIRALMAFVLMSAVGLAALRNANDSWARAMLMLTLAFVGLAVLWAILLRGRERAWWSGFAVFGGTYLVVSLGPLQALLSTTPLLEYVHAKAASSSIATIEVSRFDRNSVLYRVVSFDGGVSERKVPDNVVNSTTGDDLLASIAPVNRWRAALPGAANHDPFFRVGHSLLALLTGLLGGTAVAWFRGRRERESMPDSLRLS